MSRAAPADYRGGRKTAAVGDRSRFHWRPSGPGRFGPAISIAGAVTLLSGAFMLWFAGVSAGGWFGSAYGRAIVSGAVAGVVAAILGMSVNSPTARRLSRLHGEIQAAGGRPAEAQLAEIARLPRRLRIAGVASAILLGYCVIAMAAAGRL